MPSLRYLCQGLVGVELKAPRGAIDHARAQIGKDGMGGHGTIQDPGLIVYFPPLFHCVGLRVKPGACGQLFLFAAAGAALARESEALAGR